METEAVKAGRGRFKDAKEVGVWADGLESLHADPTQLELAAELDVPESLLDADQRTLELANWVASLPLASRSEQ